MTSTIVLDILNHQAAIQNNFTEPNAGVIITADDKVRREKIPKRATLINTCLFVPWFVYMAVFGNSFGLGTETRMFFVALPNCIVNAVRNPLISRLAFHVNKQIIRQTVEDQRKYEIEEALQKRQEQRLKNEKHSSNSQQDIFTVSQFVNVKPIPRRCSMPNIEV